MTRKSWTRKSNRDNKERLQPKNKMNAERLHAITTALHKEMVDAQTGSQIAGLVSSLQQMLQQNNHPQFQQNLANNLKRIYSTLSNCPSDNFSPAWKQLLSEMGGSPFFGLALKRTVEEIFQRNQITPSVALGELQQLSQQVVAFQQALDQILAAFKQFKIGNEKLEPGQSEIGMLIPREAVDNSLNGFAREIEGTYTRAEYIFGSCHRQARMSFQSKQSLQAI